MKYLITHTHRYKLRFLLSAALLAVTANLHASGNHPEAGACSADKPYFAICTHSLHKLEGWYSRECYATQEEAQKRAEEHAREYHNGNMRWTGIRKQQGSDY